MDFSPSLSDNIYVPFSLREKVPGRADEGGGRCDCDFPHPTLCATLSQRERGYLVLSHYGG